MTTNTIKTSTKCLTPEGHDS